MKREDLKSLWFPSACMVLGFAIWISLSGCSAFGFKSKEEAERETAAVLKAAEPYVPFPWNYGVSIISGLLAGAGAHHQISRRSRAKIPETPGSPSQVKKES